MQFNVLTPKSNQTIRKKRKKEKEKWYQTKLELSCLEGVRLLLFLTLEIDVKMVSFTYTTALC